MSQANLQTHSLPYPNSSLKHTRNMDEEGTPEFISAPSSESPSRSLSMTMESRCSSTSPESPRTEWSQELVSTNPTPPQTSSSDELAWPFDPPKHSGVTFLGAFAGNPGDNSGYSYHYGVDDRHYAPEYLLLSPNEIFSQGFHEYSLCVPPELSSICLDNQHTRSRPVPLPTRNIQWDHSTPIYTNPSGTSFLSPGSLYPTPDAYFPFTNQMAASTATTPTPSRYSRSTDGEDGDYVPELHSKRKTRTTTGAKRHTNNQHHISSSHYRESSDQRHRCTFPSCSLAFARARDLKRHFRLHSGELPYNCFGCGRSFIRSDARARHWRSRPECHGPRS